MNGLKSAMADVSERSKKIDVDIEFFLGNIFESEKRHTMSNDAQWPISLANDVKTLLWAKWNFF